MTYSSGYFDNKKKSLTEAQIDKYELLCKKLRISENDHILEIGCGWGGFVIYAAKKYGCRITAVTNSKEQFQYTRKRILDTGLSGIVNILYEIIFRG